MLTDSEVIEPGKIVYVDDGVLAFEVSDRSIHFL